MPVFTDHTAHSIILEKIPSTRPLAAVLAGNLVPLTQTIEPPMAEEVESDWEPAELR